MSELVANSTYGLNEWNVGADTPCYVDLPSHTCDSIHSMFQNISYSELDEPLLNIANLLEAGSDKNSAKAIQDFVIKHIPDLLTIGQAGFLFYAATVCPTVLAASLVINSAKDYLPLGDFLDSAGQISVGICLGNTQAVSLLVQIIGVVPTYIALKPAIELAINSSFETVYKLTHASENPFPQLNKDSAGELSKDFVKRAVKYPVKQQELNGAMLGTAAVIGISLTFKNKEFTRQEVDSAFEKVFIKYGVCFALFPFYTKVIAHGVSMEACVRSYYFAKNYIQVKP